MASQKRNQPLPTKEEGLFKQMSKLYDARQYKKGIKAADQVRCTCFTLVCSQTSPCPLKTMLWGCQSLLASLMATKTYARAASCARPQHMQARGLCRLCMCAGCNIKDLHTECTAARRCAACNLCHLCCCCSACTHSARLPMRCNITTTMPIYSAPTLPHTSHCAQHASQHWHSQVFAMQILKKVPNHGDTLGFKALLVGIYPERKQEAFELCKAGLKADIKSYLCWHVYATLYKNDRNYEQAAKCFAQALRIDPQNLGATRELTSVQLQLRDYEGLVNSATALLGLRSNVRSHWLTLAVAHHLTGNYSLAIQARYSLSDVRLMHRHVACIHADQVVCR